MQDSVNDRRDFRFPCLLEAEAEVAGVYHNCKVKNVSIRGLFLRTEKKPALRQLMRLKFAETGLDKSLSLTAMVIRQGKDGVGLELFANDRDAVRTWEEIVEAESNRVPEGSKPQFTTKDTPQGEQGRRRFARFSAVIELRFRTPAELKVLYTENVSQGGMFIATDLRLEIGSEVLLDVVHPATEKITHIMALVSRRNSGDEEPGFGVVFHNMDDMHREAFWKFVEGTALRSQV